MPLTHYIRLGEVPLRDLAAAGAYPAGQVLRDGEVWVALPQQALLPIRIDALMARLGYPNPDWETVSEENLFCRARRQGLPEAAATPAAAEAPKPELAVQIRSFIGAQDAAFREELVRLIGETLFPIVKRNVNLWVPHNFCRDPIYGPEFNIFVWSSPTPVDQAWSSPPIAFGCSITSNQGNKFSHWAEGMPIMSPEGDEIGALDGNNLYVYSDVVHIGNNTELRFWRRFLAEAIKVYASYSDSSDPGLARQQYISLCKNRSALQIRQIEADLAGAQERIKQATQQMTSAVRDKEAFNRLLTGLMQADAGGEGRFGAEFDSLCKLPKVASVLFRRNTLVVATDMLTAVNPATGRTHQIGKFKFIVDTERGLVKMLNQTRLVDAFRPKMQGPHIFPDGRPCLGNLEATVPDLVAAFEFSALVQILLAYVESVNLDDGAGRYIERWPMIRSDGSLDTSHRASWHPVASIEEMRAATLAAIEAGHVRPVEEAPAPAAPAAPAATQPTPEPATAANIVGWMEVP